MRTLTTILVTAALCALTEWVFPWWTIAVVSFTVSVFTALRPGRAFVAGFCGVALWWLIAAFIRDIPNDHILATKMAVLFHLPGYQLFIIVSALIGGITGGMAASAGALINRKR